MTKILIDEAVVDSIDRLIESARLLGATQAKQGFGVYTQEDSVMERSFYESAHKHKSVIRQALAEAWQPAQQEPVGRTDRQIVDQTEELAVWLLSWAFNRQPETPTPMRESPHPMAERCWAAACHIQEMLTATDPENAVAELDDAPQPPAQPLTPEWYARWIRNNYQDHPNIATLCDEMTKAAHGITKGN